MIFHGSVQGVGFRWTASAAARRYGISGWVRNLSDGTVEMEAEGTAADIRSLTDDLCGIRWGHVDAITSEDIPPRGGYGFEVR